MDKIVVKGGKRLEGTVPISGAKNAVLPIMAATLLGRGTFRITNVPDLRDVKTMAHLLRIIGAQVEFSDHALTIDTSNCNFFEAPYELVKTMRASIYVLGPLVARFSQARVSLPGGCALGPRPVNLHLKGLQKLGAQVELKHGYIVANAKRLRGANISFDVSTVGGTGNLLMAAVLADGVTVMENAAREPEITALAQFLVKMGADIEGIGTDRLKIRGVKELHPVDFEVIPDRIETGTFLLAAAITGGEIRLTNCDAGLLSSLLAKLRETGASLEVGDGTIYVRGPEEIKPVDVTTAPYPGFPTDLQAQWMSLMCVAQGSSVITETIFSDRFTHVAELRRLGAQIALNENVAVVTGVEKLSGATVMSTDLRASASLILAALRAEGRSDVLRVYHIDRGYEHIEAKLRAVGAEIWREEGRL
ncbi:MAG: UDP-N-acetylglucosamine 1-carboxyvinyltransferase [Calditrichaeota bacterium]|nr:MAG: UDP-N-acetylglucosamine 1-carboxyvinyltransferase [Calditrichota bacterium]